MAGARKTPFVTDINGKLRRVRDLTGRRFSRLTVVSLCPDADQTIWTTRCDCGALHKVRAGNLVSGAVKSCGCLRSDAIKMPGAHKSRILPNGNGNRWSDHTGKRYGRLVAISWDRGGKGGKLRWLLRCDCGNFKYSTLPKSAKSCGCLKIESSKRNGVVTHGEARARKRSAEYKTWRGIIFRCENSNSAGFRNYGGKGIRICNEWRNSFEKFLEDMGRKPTTSHTIERKDNSKGYEPANCIWATTKMQGKNRSTTKLNDEAVREIRMSGARGDNHQSIASRYGVSRSLISQVLLRKRWDDVK